MNYIVADIEGSEIQPLLKDIHTIHCIALKEKGKETKCYTSEPKPYSDGTLQEALKIMNKAEVIIGHNFIKFDRPVIENLLGKLNTPIIDTLIDAKLTIPRDDLFRRDMQRQKIDKSLWGSYSLKAFGQRMGLMKLDFDQWEKLTEEMVIYCKRDVEVTEKLYLYLIEYATYPSAKVRELEYEVARIIGLQEEFGCYFDYDKAMDYATRLQFDIMNVDMKLKKEFPPIFVPDGEPVYPKKGTRGNNHTIDLPLDIHRNIKPYRGLPINLKRQYVFPKKVQWDIKPFRILKYKPTGEYQKIKLKVLNPGSRQQIIERLNRKFGWEPISYTQLGNPKFDYEAMEAIKATKDEGDENND